MCDPPAWPLTLEIIAKVTVRTRTIDLSLLLGGSTIGVDRDISDDSLISLSLERLPFD